MAHTSEKKGIEDERSGDIIVEFLELSYRAMQWLFPDLRRAYRHVTNDTRMRTEN